MHLSVVAALVVPSWDKQEDGADADDDDDRAMCQLCHHVANLVTSDEQVPKYRRQRAAKRRQLETHSCIAARTLSACYDVSVNAVRDKRVPTLPLCDAMNQLPNLFTNILPHLRICDLMLLPISMFYLFKSALFLRVIAI